MSEQYVLAINNRQATIESVGGKGASLARLTNAGLPVPAGFHITTKAYRRFVADNNLQPVIQAALAGMDLTKPSDLEAAAAEIQSAFMAVSIPDDIARTIVNAYGDLSGINPAVAVRSSATAEDLPEASFAGQQESYLNICGADQVLEATKKCWSSLWTARAIGYRAKQGVATTGLALAVVVQELVPAEVAGILFTANPLTGNTSHALISAAWGLGDAVVGGRVTPDDYLLDKVTKQIVKRDIADKQVMTALSDGTTTDQPVPENLRHVPVMEDEDLYALLELGITIENLYGMPMDVEWALADGQLFIVQARPITTLPEVVIPPPNEWMLPEPKGRYMRTSTIDFLPDPLSPLFATMGVSAYNRSLQQMMVEVTGADKKAYPDELIVTIQDYAYMQANYSARMWWAMLSKLAPRIIKLIREGPDHFREVALPAYQKKVKELDGKSVREMPAAEIWRDAHELVYAAVYHLSILQVDTLGASAGSEGLFTSLYKRFYQQNGHPRASTYLMGYDTMPIRVEKSLYDLAQWSLEQPSICTYINKKETTQIVAALAGEEVPADVDPEIWAEWKRRLGAYRDTYGHILYDLDFAKPVPAEDLAPSLETVKMYMRGEGVNPHERQARLETEREQATKQLLERTRWLRGWAVRKALGWASSMAQVREDSIASIGLAYPRLRELLLELGQRLVEAGVIASPSDIFWLEEAEISQRLEALQQGDPLESLQEMVSERQKIRLAEQQVIPPTQLPYSKTYMGIPVEVFIPGEGGQEGDRLKGVAASSGRVTGTACVLHGPEDFDQMEQGLILVAKFTTPAWTPLFAMAAGVVTDIGGPLSHGSIVSREYGIPAVMGTIAATRVIQSGQRITVDGDNGLVILSTEE